MKTTIESEGGTKSEREGVSENTQKHEIYFASALKRTSMNENGTTKIAHNALYIIST